MTLDAKMDDQLDVSSTGRISRLEVLEGPTGRRQRSEAEQARIAAESFRPGVSVSEVARRYGATLSQVYDRRRLKDGRLKAQLAETEAALAESREAQERLEKMVRQMQREKFAACSEQLSPDQFNLPLEELDIAEGMMAAARERAEVSLKGKPPGAEQPPQKRNRGHLPPHLPRIERLCKHVAATLYGVGARLDSRPELLFLLRGVDQQELITQVTAAPATAAGTTTATTEKVLGDTDLSALFGLALDEPEARSNGDEEPLSKV